MAEYKEGTWPNEGLPPAPSLKDRYKGLLHNVKKKVRGVQKWQEDRAARRTEVQEREMFQQRQALKSEREKLKLERQKIRLEEDRYSIQARRDKLRKRSGSGYSVGGFTISPPSGDGVGLFGSSKKGKKRRSDNIFGI